MSTLKIFLIFKGFCHEDVTRHCPTLEATKRKYAPDFHFVEAPDYVFEGWGVDEIKDGDERFIKPVPPDGWLYDDETGTFFSLEMIKDKEISELKQKLSDTDYQAIKYAEGWITDGEYEPIKAQRQEWRDAINALESGEEVSVE